MNGSREEINNFEEFFRTVYPKESAFQGKLYYDETNNFRKFYLKEDGWNCEALNLFYVLGGLAIEKGQVVNINSLLAKLRFQKGIKEIKLKNMVSNSTGFLDILTSNRIDTFLNWLLENNIKTHYQIMNFVFFALADIVDAAMESYIEIYDQELVLPLKNVLYEIVKQEIDYFGKLLFKYISLKKLVKEVRLKSFAFIGSASSAEKYNFQKNKNCLTKTTEVKYMI